jgi:uncharacterized sporulation protein YeaH/YhbH (DUF444 family)
MRAAVFAVERGELDVAGACRRYGIARATYFRWQRRYGADASATAERMRALEARIEQLERIAEERLRSVEALRKLVREVPRRGRPPPRGAESDR